MSYWNYRVIKIKQNQRDPNTEEYEIRVVYYKENALISQQDLEDVALYGGQAATPYGNTRDELLEDLAMMLKGLTKPVLNEIDLEHQLDILYSEKPHKSMK